MYGLLNEFVQLSAWKFSHILTCGPHKGLKNCIYFSSTKNWSQSLLGTLASWCPCPGGSQQLQEVSGDWVSRRDAVIFERGLLLQTWMYVYHQVNLWEYIWKKKHVTLRNHSVAKHLSSLNTFSTVLSNRRLHRSIYVSSPPRCAPLLENSVIKNSVSQRLRLKYS